MLVITRRIDEAIIIEGAILVKVLGIEPGPFGGPGKVKLGISAPPETLILRYELADPNPHARLVKEEAQS